MSEEPNVTIEDEQEDVLTVENPIDEPAALPDPRVEVLADPGEGQKFHHRGRSPRMDALTWSGILIWAGVVLLADNLGLLARLNLNSAGAPWLLPISAEAWTVFFLGVGVLMLVGVILRLLIPAFRYDVLGNTILTIVAFSIALGKAELIWPLILIAVGVSVISGKIR